ncbi:hypothetical protein TRVL_09867 [Trypanosoma vivax]|nr:hypothetical protein TRVL_09867 [Trypanosoma vivax]
MLIRVLSASPQVPLPCRDSFLSTIVQIPSFEHILSVSMLSSWCHVLFARRWRLANCASLPPCGCGVARVPSLPVAFCKSCAALTSHSSFTSGALFSFFAFTALAPRTLRTQRYAFTASFPLFALPRSGEARTLFARASSPSPHPRCPCAHPWRYRCGFVLCHSFSTNIPPLSPRSLSTHRFHSVASFFSAVGAVQPRLFPASHVQFLLVEGRGPTKRYPLCAPSRVRKHCRRSRRTPLLPLVRPAHSSCPPCPPPLVVPILTFLVGVRGCH